MAELDPNPTLIVFLVIFKLSSVVSASLGHSKTDCVVGLKAEEETFRLVASKEISQELACVASDDCLLAAMSSSD